MGIQDPAGVDGAPPRVVVVTGAGKGLGRAFARAWAGRGACVVVNNRKHGSGPGSADAVVDEIRAAGGQAVADYHDVCDPQAAERLVQLAVGQFGGLDALILNAGVNGPAARLEAQGLADFAAVMEVNLFANIRLTQVALPHLQAGRSPRLLFIASSAGLYGVRGRAPYAASKGAVIALALTLAKEQKRAGVGVNVLAPYAATQMTPAELNAVHGDRLAPELSAPMALWLTGPSCAATGEIWVAGGGYVRRARMEEGLGGRPERLQSLSPEWIEANLAQLSDMAEGTGFPDAETAFADLMQRLD
jgi:NAD(P)-dependent dehydrogenase (short-subunit alcohol dehydrogenase family)